MAHANRHGQTLSLSLTAISVPDYKNLELRQKTAPAVSEKKGDLRLERNNWAE